MEHGTYPVDILNKDGLVIGAKARRTINKEVDIYHAVYVLVVTPNKQMLLSIIPPREDLPNLYTRQFGVTMATIRRTGETAAAAAKRGISRELFIDEAEPVCVGESMESFKDGRCTYISLFYLEGPVPDSFSVIDVGQLESMSRAKFEALLAVKPERVSPPLRTLWQKYANKIPV